MTQTPAEPHPRPEAAKVILRGGGSAAFGFVLRLGARLLFLFVAGRLFGATLFGAFSLAVAVVELAVTIGSVGTKKILFQFLDERDERIGRTPAHVVVDAAVLVTATSALLAAAIMAVVLFLPESILSPNTAFALVVLAPMIVGQAVLDLFSAATRWQHRMRYEVVGRSIVEPYAGVAATLVAVALGFSGAGLLIGYWIGTLSALLYVGWGARGCFGGFGLAHYRTRPRALLIMLRGTTSNTANDFVNALYARLDLYLVGLLLGEGSAGIYGMARQIRTPIRHVRQSFDGLLTPIVAKTLAAKGPVETGIALASASRLILVIQLPLLIVLATVGVPLLNAVGPGFALGYWALLLLAAAESIQGTYSVGDLIFVYRKPGLGLWITVASTILGLAAGLVLIPAWGVTGAGITVLLSYAARALHRRHVLKASFAVRGPVAHNFGPLLAAAAGTVAALLVVTWSAGSPVWSYSLALIAGLGVYAALLFTWLKLSGNSLAIEGFVTGARPQPDAALP